MFYITSAAVVALTFVSACVCSTTLLQLQPSARSHSFFFSLFCFVFFGHMAHVSAPKLQNGSNSKMEGQEGK